jgi:glycine cleavage system pyridoxal-binding protein P
MEVVRVMRFRAARSPRVEASQRMLQLIHELQTGTARLNGMVASSDRSASLAEASLMAGAARRKYRADAVTKTVHPACSESLRRQARVYPHAAGARAAHPPRQGVEGGHRGDDRDVDARS